MKWQAPRLLELKNMSREIEFLINPCAEPQAKSRSLTRIAWNFLYVNIYPFFANTPMNGTRSIVSARVKELPSFMIDRHEMMIRAVLRGIRKRRHHVYPGFFSKTVFP